MRSELVFRARDRVANRYLLCRATAKTTRRLHFASANTADAITDAFVRMADALPLEYHPADSISFADFSQESRTDGSSYPDICSRALQGD
jgi:hypothetical protein